MSNIQAQLDSYVQNRCIVHSKRKWTSRLFTMRSMFEERRLGVSLLVDMTTINSRITLIVGITAILVIAIIVNNCNMSHSDSHLLMAA
jgi:hypothetical protein